MTAPSISPMTALVEGVSRVGCVQTATVQIGAGYQVHCFQLENAHFGVGYQVDLKKARGRPCQIALPRRGTCVARCRRMRAVAGLD